MISVISEHSVDLSLLPKKATILDLGCRGFGFTDYFRKLGHSVYPVDIDEFEGSYFQCAISGSDGRTGIYRTLDPQATRIADGDEVAQYTIESFSEKVGVKWWDLIKMDIEMAEYQAIMGLKKAPAKQLSVEFHLHYQQYTQIDMLKMEKKIKSLGYDFVQHHLDERHGAGYNYWDSLFVLR